MEADKEGMSSIIMEQYWWKRGKRELCLIHKDEYGLQYLLFYVTGNKKFRLRFILDHHDRLKYVQTLGNYVMNEEWKLLGDDDDVLG